MTAFFTVCLLASLILLRTAPDTPLSRFLRRWLVLWPIGRMRGFRRHEWLLLISAMVALGASHWLFPPDSFVFISRLLAEAAPWLTSVEVSTCLDIATAVLLSRVITRTRAVLRLNRRTAMSFDARSMKNRRRTPRQTGNKTTVASPKGRATNDDEVPRRSEQRPVDTYSVTSPSMCSPGSMAGL